MFEDRKDAGEKFAAALSKYKGTDAIVLAIPKGGVEVGYQIAKYLDAGFSILVSRKLPYPGNPEAGFGAVAEDGSIFIHEYAAGRFSGEVINSIIEEQKQKIKRRIEVLRHGRPLPEIAGRNVILVDDGIAMGSTMHVSIMLCRNKKAGRIVAAAPVSGQQVAAGILELVDELTVLEQPAFF